MDRAAAPATKTGTVQAAKTDTVQAPRTDTILATKTDTALAAKADAAAVQAGPARVRAVRSYGSAGAARLVLDVDGEPTVTAFSLKSPARIVVDLERAEWLQATRSIAGSGGLLTRVRVSQHTPAVVRVVCDLDRPSPYRVETVPGGLVLHVGGGVR
jgi:hypothetical protein